jgi:hypothetical protein
MAAVDASGVAIELVTGGALTAVPAAVAAAAAAALPPLPPVLLQKVADLSGAIHSGADLLRHAPALAAAVQSLALSGLEKKDLVLRAAEMAVERYVPAEERPAALALVRGALPATLTAILDVAKGRVEIGAALRTAAVEVVSNPEVQAAGLNLLQQCLACLMAPRQQPAAAPSAPKPAE